MLDYHDKADVALRIHFAIQRLCEEEGKGLDAMKAITLLAGMYVESAFLFDNCEESLQGMFIKLGERLSCEPLSGEMYYEAMPPSSIIDFDSEMGRAMAREFFEEWLDCEYEFNDMLLELTQQMFMHWEAAQGGSNIRQTGQRRAESFRLLVECTYRAMAYEIAAQELCDVVIEKKIGVDGWNMADSISGLAGLAGRKLSLSHGGRNQCCWFMGADLPDLLDQTAYVMTQEAVRLGIPTGTDWRFGLPANDTPANAPTLLVGGVENICEGFFQAIGLYDYNDQAVCAAKAAGRMLAVACAGERPDLEPAIAKPLSMAALTETYKSACVEYAVEYSAV
ncbi:MAG: hypothetical protein R3D88_00745 [Alphaproteobacteria bacterium]|nr:hypothetical protein [Alphaproteobacteria bacterium]